MRKSSRSQVDPFIVMDVMAAAAKADAEGRHIIHMEVGQPATPAPKPAQEALAVAMQTDAMGYTVALGRPDLRAAISDLYRRWYGVDVPPKRIVITAGSSAAFTLAFVSCFELGACVGIGAPGYPSYRNILQALGLTCVDITTKAENKFQITPQDIDNHTDLEGFLVASPANPTGTTLGAEALSALVDAAKKRGVTMISDEIYHGISYGQRDVSALEFTDDVIVINSFSKYFSMTGWRLGWMVVPEDHVRTIERLAQNLFICAPHAAQIAALGALSSVAEPELRANIATYTKNRQLLLDALPKMGFGLSAPPEGAFFIYADASAFTQDSPAFCAEVLAKAGVAITPGVDFDPARGHAWVRFSYARATEDIKEGIERLRRYLNERA